MIERSKTARPFCALCEVARKQRRTDQSAGRRRAVEVHLHLPVGQRGWFKPGRRDCWNPPTLWACCVAGPGWTWTCIALVYPRPLGSADLPGLATDKPDGASVPVPGSDDFYGFRSYQKGDSLRHIHWKGVAKGQGVQSKQYTAYADRQCLVGLGAFSRHGY